MECNTVYGGLLIIHCDTNLDGNSITRREIYNGDSSTLANAYGSSAWLWLCFLLTNNSTRVQLVCVHVSVRRCVCVPLSLSDQH